MRFVALIIFLFTSFSTFADTLENKEEAKNLVKSIMSKVEKEHEAEAFALMRPYFVISQSEFDLMVEQMALQVPIVKQRFGNSLGVEFLGAEEVGESLMLVVYIQKFEKHLVRWKFYFYKPSNAWVLNTFFKDDQIQTIFSK